MRSSQQEKKRKQGVGETRDHLKSTSFVDAEGTIISKDDHGTKRKMDRKAFWVHMNNCHRWDNSKSSKSFDHYAAIASAPHDYGGPLEFDNGLRLQFPSWLTCDDYADDVTSNYQDRAMATSSKAEALSDEHGAKLRQETKSGFKALETLTA